MISLAMIVRDEAERLDACLDSVAGLADEIVIVDTGSRDGTREMARRRGAHIFEWAWRDDFAAARNESLRHATGDWILVLDADERLAPGAAEAIRALTGRTDVDGVDCRLVSTLPSDQPSTSIAAWFCRMFRNQAHVRFEGRLHEQVAPSIRAAGGAIVRGDVAITHLGYAQPSAAKLARNLRLLRLELADRPGDAFVLFHLGLTLHSSGDWKAGSEALEDALAATVRPLGPDLRAVAWTKLAEGRLVEERWAEAATACEHALAEEPALSLARYALGRARFELGDLDGASAAFEALREAPPDALGMTLQPRLLALARALVHLREQRWGEAARVLEPLAGADPTGELAFQLGNAYLGLRRLRDAQHCYEEARAAGFASAHLERRAGLCTRLVERLSTTALTEDRAP